MSENVYFCPMKRIWNKETIQKEIEEMDAYLPVSKIEEKLGMPPTTLQKVLSGKRELPKKWLRVLESYFVRKPESEPAPPTEEKEIKKQPAQNIQKEWVARQPFMSEAIKKKLGIR